MRLKKQDVRSFRWTVFYLVGLVVSVLLIVSAGSGCSATPSPYKVNHTAFEPCQTDDDCTVDGEICAPHQVCLPRSAGGVPFAVELAPSESPDRLNRRLAPYEIPSLGGSLDPGGPTDVIYPQAVSLTGSVMVVNEARVPLEATMTVARPSRIPGRSPVMTAQTITAEGFLLSPRPEDVEPSFTLWVPPDEPLTLRAAPVSPFDQSYHPLRREVTLSTDSEEWFVFGDPETSIHVAGTVVDALGSPVPGLQVRAVDDETGTLESSLGVTDETGTYHLLLPRGLRSYRVQLVPETTNSTHLTFLAEGVEIGAMADVQGRENSYDNPEQVPTLHLPAYSDPIPVTLQLQGRSSDGSLVPVPGALVTLKTEFGAPGTIQVRYEVTATSDEAGQVQVDLLPGDAAKNRAYRVTVLTPVDASSEFASDVLDGDRALQVGLSGGVMTLELTRRIAVATTVFSDGWGEIAGLTVQARRLDGPVELRDTLRSVSTDQTGRFSLRLEPGTYRVELLPPAGIPLPRWVLADPWVVGEDELPVFPDGLAAPEPEVLELRVITADPEPAPLPYVRVSLYQVDATCAALNPVDIGLCDRPPAFLGDAVTDASGRVRLLVPASE